MGSEMKLGSSLGLCVTRVTFNRWIPQAHYRSLPQGNERRCSMRSPRKTYLSAERRERGYTMAVPCVMEESIPPVCAKHGVVLLQKQISLDGLKTVSCFICPVSKSVVLDSISPILSLSRTHHSGRARPA